jgi:PDZ domain-containing protein
MAATLSGYVLALAVAGWGLFLLSQRVRFSVPTATIAFVIAGLILVTLIAYRASRPDHAEPHRSQRSASTYLRLPLAAPVIAAMFIPFAGLMPVNEGIQAPGSAISTEEMVHVPDDVRHEVSGSLLLTTIILQTPIVAFEWAAARMSPVIELVPPERVVPAGTTPQSVARRNYNALVTSEETAAVVAVRLAGYEVTASSDGAFVNSVSPDSPSSGIIQPGDVITAFNGQPVTGAQEVIDLTRAADPAQPVTLRVSRDGEDVDLTIELIPPASADGTPRIGISIETAGLTYDLPFPVEITPKKIAGGPSAGLMFTLTVYDLLTEEDLTGGRKIAGTGTIDANGNVGPIGGVQQKVAAAERAGAEYFLCPEQNYADAAAVADEIEVVQVTTAEEAIEFLRSLPPA